MSSINTTLEAAVLLSVCVTGCAVGWRIVVPGLALFLLVCVIRRQGDDCGVLALLVVLGGWYALRRFWCGIKSWRDKRNLSTIS